MQLQTMTLIIVCLLSMVNQYVHTKSIITEIYSSSSSTSIRYSNRTTTSKSKPPLPTCLFDRDCRMHGRCEDGECRCDKGWITWQNSGQCLYKQSSKIMALIISFLVGIVGIDWFVLSRRDSLYILCGILKLLIFTGCCIWSPLAARSKSKTATTAASCLSVTLSIISFIWWFIDWIRIIFNNFPDGNGAALI